MRQIRPQGRSAVRTSAASTSAMSAETASSSPRSPDTATYAVRLRRRTGRACRVGVRAACQHHRAHPRQGLGHRHVHPGLARRDRDPHDRRADRRHVPALRRPRIILISTIRATRPLPTPVKDDGTGRDKDILSLPSRSGRTSRLQEDPRHASPVRVLPAATMHCCCHNSLRTCGTIAARCGCSGRTGSPTPTCSCDDPTNVFSEDTSHQRQPRCAGDLSERIIPRRC